MNAHRPSRVGPLRLPTLSGPQAASRGALLIRCTLYVAAALPALYLFLAIARGAITVPFWDHCGLIETIAPWYDGTFRIASLWAPDNQARPLVYRLVMGANAIVTDWDVRSEFTYIYACFYGVFALHAWALKTLTAGAPQRTIVFPLSLLLASIVVFSPVSHNDQWWSLMFILDGANLLILITMLIVFFRPSRIGAHIAAAAACWLASYSATNGIFAMLAVMLVFQLTSARLLRPNRFALFWAANLAVLLALYLPGIVTSGGRNPGLLQMAEFSFTFLGLPFGGLLHFPYRGQFDLPVPIALNAACGIALVAVSALLCWHAWPRLRAGHPACLILFGFTIFALLSAVITAWGRANFDALTVSNGNSSRYSIFGAYLLLGQIDYLAAGFAGGWWRGRIFPPAALLAAIIFAAFAAVSYGDAIKIFDDAHKFNQAAASAYGWGTQPGPNDKDIFPDPGFIIKLKSDLQRLELGPYSNRQYESAALPAGGFKTVFDLSDAGQISQSFTASKAGLKDIMVTLASPNGSRAAGLILWRLTAAGNSQPIASGVLNARHIQDWQTLRLKLPYLADSAGREYRISFSSAADTAHALAMPLYAPAGGQNPTVTITNQGAAPETETLTMPLVLNYAD